MTQIHEHPIGPANAGALPRRTILVLASAFLLPIGGCVDRSGDGQEALPEFRLVALAPITGEDTPGGLGRIADLEMGHDGTVYVLDGMNRTIHVFDTTGSLLRSFGQQGQGPGELESPSALAWGPEGNLWVVDPGNGRFTVFETSGRVVGGHSASDPFFHPMAFGFSEAGHLHAAGIAFEGGRLEEPSFFFVRSELEGDRVRELQRVELPFVEQPEAFELRGDGMLLLQPIPFSSEPLFRLDSRGRLWYAETREPWVHRWSPSGGLEMTVGRPFDPPRVRPADLQAALGQEQVDELRRAVGAAAWAEFTARIPDTWPHLEGFFLDDADAPWIIRTSEEKGDGRLLMEVYDPDGTLLATARAALEADPMPRVRAGLLAGVTRDDLGVESVALYRIER